ncbi:151_t:CDS:1, partial [Scutellospora calospora]
CLIDHSVSGYNADNEFNNLDNDDLIADNSSDKSPLNFDPAKIIRS